MPCTHSTSRRTFLAATGAALAAGLPGATALTSRLAAASREMDEAGRFEALLGQRFALAGDAGRGTLVLVDVRRQILRRDDARPAHCRREPFSLLLRAEQGVHVGEGLHRLEHPRLDGRMTCLHPVGPHGTDYEVHFS